jgi:WD40 repeat protein
MKPLTGHIGSVISVGFSPDGTHIVSGSSDRTIRIWDLRTGEEVIKPLTGHIGIVTSVGFSPDGTYIVSGSSDRTIRIWDLRTGEQVMKPLRGHNSRVTSVGFSPDGNYVVSGSSDDTIRVWDVMAEMESRSDLPFQPHLHFASVSPDGWIRGPHQELIFWVLPEWRNFVQLPSCVLNIGRPAAHFSLRHYVHGLEWTRCISNS